MVDIRDKIIELDSQIQNWEDIDPAFIHENLRKLRHQIFFVYSVLERGMEILIVRNVNPLSVPESPVDQSVGTSLLIYEILAYVPFHRKVELCKKWKLISQETVTLINKIKNLRDQFAHPDAYEIKKYHDYDLHFQLLKDLTDAYEAMNKLFA